jgi:NADH pyrophosphatase NudC (nudix superfamily)
MRDATMFAYLLTALLAAVVGFAGGMATWQKSRRWCPQCGITLKCQVCQPAPDRTGQVQA